ncbi:LamG-like jellyroll fold domain-containing protein [Chloroflexus sp.]|uniref:LamG-like jellyroll fold domain-containing protein n=1 Tax=Chloroflexus sp. TaxID=1904827 RepID=UPI002ADD8554|nr:LamG-like jellyroll fold domain-containing protein [Chloroflexus sp.]
MHYRHHLLKTALSTVFLGIFLLLIAMRIQPVIAPDSLRAAWQRAISTNTYQFSVSATVLTDPQPSPLTVGQAPERQEIFLKGQTDLKADTTELSLWSQGGTVADGEGSITIRITEGQTWVRQAGGEWEEYPGLADLYAPGGDLMGYLAAVRDVETLGEQVVHGVTMTRYRFRLDGPALERYLRERQQEALVRANRLPPGAELKPAEEYTHLRGSGEVWVDQNGLPVRQIIDLTLPTGSTQRLSHAQITMDFFGFGPLPTSPPFAWQHLFWNILNVLNALAPSVIWLSAFLSCLIAIVVLIQRRSVLRFNSLISMVVLVTLISGPLLTAHRAYAIQASEAERSVASQQIPAITQTPSDREAQMPAEFAAAHIVADVLLSEVRNQSTYDHDRDGLSDIQEHMLGTDPYQATDSKARLESLITQATPALPITPASLVHDGRDSDGDGLNDFQELFLGTSRFESDTDGDGLSDFAEARGFSYNGRDWFLDPLAMDTNRDGIIDSLEVIRNGSTLLPRDTDSDGVPDAFDRDNDNDGVPDALDLSPSTHSGSQGAFNGNRALWLKLDNLYNNTLVAVDFQVRPQDANQLWYAQSRFDWPNDGAGQIQDRNATTDDLQLIPLLEISIPANSFATLPSYTDNGNGNLSSPILSAQGITIRRADDSTIVAYVPLSLMTNQQTGERVAFSGRMLYRGVPGWGTAHRVRLVWAVQTKNDVDGFDKPGIVHVYANESWTLTGMQIREDHGVSGALVVADPAAQGDAVARDDALFALINSLDQTFLRGRTDLSPTTIASRFDHPSNNSIPDEQRWGLPDIFRVRTYNETDTLSLARNAATRNRSVLSDWIPAQYQPLILNVRHETFRALNFDSLGSNASWADTVLSLNLTNGGPNAVHIQTTAHLSLTGYEFSAGDWRALSAEQTVQRFVSRHQSQASTDDDLKTAQLTILRNYLAVLIQGIVTTIINGQQRPTVDLAAPDASMTQINTALAAQSNGALKHAMSALGEAQGSETNAMLKQMGKVIITLGISAARGGGAAWAVSAQFVTSFKAKAGDAIRGAIIGALVAGLVMAATAQIGTISPELNRWLQTGGMELVQQVTSSVATIIKNGIDLILIAKFGLQKITAASAAFTIVIGGVLVLATVGLAIYEAIANQLSGVALAQLIITTVLQVAWIVFLTALAFVPKVGPIIVAVLVIIDAVLSIFLSIILGRATTFSSWLFQQIARFIVDESRYLTVKPTVSGTNLGLINPAAGMTAWNPLRFSAIVYPNLDWNPHRIGNRWFGHPWNDWQARQRVSGVVSLATSEQNLNTWPGWPPIEGSYSRAVDFSFPAGINHATSLWLNTAFNLPYKRCIFLWCGAYDDVKRYNSRLADSVVFDVFPATLNEFVRMDWGGNVPFPTRSDGDLDGVAHHSDPNDASWDSDGDGLSDAFEFQRAGEGIRLSPRSADTDGDGLSDREEVLWETDPTRADTDGDGLSDRQEVDGFRVSVQGQGFWLRTSPLAVDSRGSGASDAVWLYQNGPTTAYSALASWPLNEVSGPVFTDSINRTTMSCVAPRCPDAGITISGRTGVRFDGNDYLSAGTDERFRMSDAMTFAVWMYPTANSGGILVNREGEYEVARFPDGSIQWAFANAHPGWVWINTGYFAPLNTWTHVAVTYQHGVVVTYINGNPIHNYNGSGSITDIDPFNNEFRLGNRADAYSQPFTGVLAQARIFTRALSAGEVASLLLAPASLSMMDIGSFLSSTTTELSAPVTPIGVFPQINDGDLTVRPGQSLTYTVTLQHNLLEGRPLRGAVWLNTPVNSFPSTSFELLPGQAQSFVTNLTIPASTPEGPFVLNAVTQYSPGGNLSARWAQPIFVERTSAPVSAIALAPTPGAATPYAVVTESGGQVQFLPAQPSTLGTPLTVGSGTNPTVACLSGACLVAWQHETNIHITRVTGTSVSSPVTLGSGSAPIVASNGSNFLVAWLDGGTLRAQRVAANGTLTGTQIALDNALQTGNTVALATVGTTYLAVYERGPTNQRDIWMVRIDDSGTTTPIQLTATPDDESGPALAYSTTFGRTLIAYLRNGSVFGRLLAGTILYDEILLLSDGGVNVLRPAVAAAADHFVVAAGARVANRANLLYQAVDGNNRLLGSPQRFAWLVDAPTTLNIGLACADGQPCVVTPAGLSGNSGTQIGTLSAQIVSEAAGLFDSGTLPTPLRLVVDNTPPATQIVSLANGSYVPAANVNSGLVVSGIVTDTNGIELVEISLDGGAWQETTLSGTTWATTLDISALAEGQHSLRARARDTAGNQGAASTPVTFIVDRQPPMITLSSVPSTPVRPSLDAGSGWVFPFTGTLTDPAAGTSAGSGSTLVTLELLPASSDAVTSIPQEITASGGTWQHNYRLTGGGGVDGRITPPTGVYTITMRAVDLAGNLTTVTHPTLLQLDATSPSFQMNSNPGDTITTTLVLSGVVSDTGSVASGVQAMEVAWVPQEQADVLATARVRLLFEEATGSEVFANAADASLIAVCSGTNCPQLTGGRVDQGITLNATQALSITDTMGTLGEFSIAAWINGSGRWFERGLASQPGYVELTTNSVQLWGSSATCTASFTPAGSGWQHLAATYDGTTLNVYREGVAIASTPCSAGHLSAATARIGSGFIGMVDEVHMYDYALATDEVGDLCAAADRTWQAVTLATPGATNTTWSLAVPNNLDGIYALMIRASDALANRTVHDGELIWRGLVDTRGPQVTVRVTQQGSGSLARTTITCEIRDINLNHPTVVCPEPTGTILERSDLSVFYQPAAWRRQSSDLKLLNGRDITYVVSGHISYSATGTATDTLGRNGSSNPQPVTPPARPIDILVTSPSGNVRTTLDPIVLAGEVSANAGLQRLRVLRNGSEIHNQTWPSGTPSASFSLAAWTPADGRYNLEFRIEDQNGQLLVEEMILFVDTAAPTAIGFASAVVTTGNTLTNTLALPILVTDTGVITGVQASLDGSIWIEADADPIVNGRWWLPITDDTGNLDNQLFTMALRATDAAGRQITASGQTITVDVTPPAHQNVTLRIVGGSILSDGTVVVTPGLSLRMEWTTGSDGAGPVTFFTGWNTDAEPNIASLTAYGAGPNYHDITPLDGSILYAHIVQQDANGNRQIQTFGPIIYDPPSTPAVISQTGATEPARAIDTQWRNGACNLVGQNSALARRTNDLAATNGVQRLFTAWDDRAIRLAWHGVIWDSSNDLYLYLDTAPGGASAPYRQGMSGGQLDLGWSNSFSPNYLVRIDDSTTMSLLSWNGTSWTSVSSNWQVWSDPMDPTLLEIYIPFTTLNITAPATTPVQMLAYATEEDSLRIWSVIPANNPLTSPNVLNSKSSEDITNTVTLTNVIFWDNIGAGSCPGQGQLTADVRFRITVEPIGIVYSIFTDELINDQSQLLDDISQVDGQQIAELDTYQPPLIEGQTITYTIHYENVGEVPATNVQAWIVNWGSLRLPGGTLITGVTPYYEQFINLGTINPGTNGIATFTGVVDRQIARDAGEDEDWATVDVSFHDDTTNLDDALDWFFVDHPVDITPPEHVEIYEPLSYIKPGITTLYGLVWDESDVPQIELEVTVGSASPSIVSCTDTTPEDGEWQCPVNLGTPADGTSVTIRARATDRAGLTSAWSDPLNLIVDDQAPRLILSDATITRLGLGAVGVGTLQLDGQINDERSAAAVEVCVDQNDSKGFQCTKVPVDGTNRWSYALPIREQTNQSAQHLRLTPIDEAGNRGNTQQFDYVIDTIAPTLSNNLLQPVQLQATPQQAPVFLSDGVQIGGTYSDEVGVTAITVRVERPDGLVTNGAAELQSGQWRYIVPLSRPGTYRVYVEARDAAGNVRVIGPIVVGGPYRIHLPIIQR